MKRSLLFVIFLAVAAAVIASMIFPDYILWIMVPVILGIPIVATIANIVKGRPLLRRGPGGVPQINTDVELSDDDEVPSLNLTARSLEGKK